MFLISFPVSRMRFASVFSCSRVLLEAGWLLGLLENVGNESEKLRDAHARVCVCLFSGDAENKVDKWLRESENANMLDFS